MKKFWLGILLWSTLCTATTAQIVQFSKLPADLQLYPRNEQNKASVPVRGRINTNGYSRMALWVYRNGAPYRYQTASLNYQNEGAEFSFSSEITAELATYTFKVYACRQRDSSLVVERSRIVAGDVYLINGQSNASANAPDYRFQSEYARTFGVFTPNDNYDNYNPRDTLWALSNQGLAIVGVWGTELQRRLIEQYGIPVCVINGASGGSSIEYNVIRNTSNPADLSTTYGRLLYRVSKAGVKNHIKAIFWRQGENECSGNAVDYPQNFDKLYRFWLQDYPSAQKIYVFQVNILSFPLENAGPFVRDFQRRTKQLYPKVETLATVGTMGYDGVHYQVAGHQQTASEITRLVARDFYGAAAQADILSPSIQKAYFTTATKDEIALEFDQTVRWPGDTLLFSNISLSYVRKMRDFIYLDGQRGWIQSGRSQQNIIYLKLIQGSNATKITYLPAYFADQYRDFYDGTHIKNWKGMRAFAFYDFQIDAQAPTPPPTPAPPLVVAPPPLPVPTPTPPAVVAPPKADLSLLMDVNDRFPMVGDTLTYALVVKNEGPINATNIEVGNTLPAGELLFVNSLDFVNQGGRLKATIPSLAKDGIRILRFRAKVLQTGKIWNRAELTKADQADPDSSPNNGIENGEDDCTKVDITSRALTLPPPPPIAELPPSPPITPRPPVDTAGVVLPPKQIVEPVLPKELADLSISMGVDNPKPTIGQELTFIVILKNEGPNAAQNVGFRIVLPEGLNFVSSSLLSHEAGVLSATLSSLASGASFMLSYVVRTSATGLLVSSAEITKVNQHDPDSTPDNGFDNGEDDTQRVEVSIAPLNCKSLCLPYLVQRTK
jgi:uncharacterized repeat protein (TIGR01451 family)